MLIALVMAAGAFTVGLALWHVGVPRRFGFREAIEPWRPDLDVGPFRVGPWRHQPTRADVLGVAGVMNLATTYVLVFIGGACLVAGLWVGTPGGRLFAMWLAGWWGLRAVAQLGVGRRRVDAALVAWFGGLALLFLVVASA